MSYPHVAVAECVAAMLRLPAESVDAIVTDPPYGLEFMGKGWDKLEGDVVEDPASVGGFQDGNGGNPFSRARIRYGLDGRKAYAWHLKWAEAALRIAKPGAHLVAFGGTRTYHRLGCALEDAGWELRDCLSWLYGQGFPKSLNIAKAIDGDAGAVPPPVTEVEHDLFGARTVVVQQKGRTGPAAKPNAGSVFSDDGYEWPGEFEKTEPVTDEARRWNGWGTALKPGWEPIWLARKPFDGTVAENVQRLGVGALNVDGCRLPLSGADQRDAGRVITRNPRAEDDGWGLNDRKVDEAVVVNPAGRWPANVALDGEAAAQLDEQSGTLTSGANPSRRGSNKFGTTYGDFVGQERCEPARGMDTGGARRFFFCAKADRGEREAGLEGFAARQGVAYGQALMNGSGKLKNGTGEPLPTRNFHPTVKPVDLMRWLSRLITPPRGLVLDPFCGSGTTGVAAVLEGFRFLGLEREREYAQIARARIRNAWAQPSLWP